jgi:hypothetical protein
MHSTNQLLTIFRDSENDRSLSALDLRRPRACGVILVLSCSATVPAELRLLNMAAAPAAPTAPRVKIVPGPGIMKNIRFVRPFDD